MSYLEFFQAWQNLVTQNAQIIVEPKISCFPWDSVLFCLCIIPALFIFLSFFAVLACHKLSSKKAKFAYILFIGLFLWPMCKITIYIDYLKEHQNPRCEKKKSESYSWTKYPDKDYTIEEFKGNMASIGQKASPDQIEVAQKIFQKCLENLSGEYDVNNSSQIRKCIVNSYDDFKIYETEMYKKNSISELNHN